MRVEFDAWMTPSCVAILSIIAHLMSEEGKQRYGLLGMKEIGGYHDCESLSGILWSVLDEYDIDTENILSYSIDNTASNDTIPREMERNRWE